MRGARMYTISNGPPRQLAFTGPDSAVDLPPIGIPFDADIQDRQALLCRTRNLPGQQDTAGTGAEGGLFRNKTLQGIEQAVALEELQEGSRFTARQDQAVKAGELRRFSYLDGIGACVLKRLGMSGKVSLDGEHTDAWTLLIAVRRLLRAPGLLQHRCLPAAGLQQFTLFEPADSQALHRPGHLLADLGQHLGIAVMRGGDHNCLGP